jgi:hypothetical protein
MIDTIEECQEAVNELYGASNSTIVTLVPEWCSSPWTRGCIRVQELNGSFSYLDDEYGTSSVNNGIEPICRKTEPPAANGGGGTS